MQSTLFGAWAKGAARASNKRPRDSETETSALRAARPPGTRVGAARVGAALADLGARRARDEARSAAHAAQTASRARERFDRSEPVEDEIEEEDESSFAEERAAGVGGCDDGASSSSSSSSSVASSGAAALAAALTLISAEADARDAADVERESALARDAADLLVLQIEAVYRQCAPHTAASEIAARLREHAGREAELLRLVAREFARDCVLGFYV